MDHRNEAASRLRALLAIPQDRPTAWEAEHVLALAAELRAILTLVDDPLRGWLRHHAAYGFYCITCGNSIAAPADPAEHDDDCGVKTALMAAQT